MFSSVIVTLLGKALSALTTTPPAADDGEKDAAIMARSRTSLSYSKNELDSKSNVQLTLLGGNDDELELMKQEIQQKLAELDVHWIHWTMEIHVPTQIMPEQIARHGPEVSLPSSTPEIWPAKSRSSSPSSSLLSERKRQSTAATGSVFVLSSSNSLANTTCSPTAGKQRKHSEFNRSNDYWAYRSFNSGDNYRVPDSPTDYQQSITNTDEHEEVIVVCWNVTLKLPTETLTDDSLLSSYNNASPRVDPDQIQPESHTSLFVVLTIAIIRTPVRTRSPDLETHSASYAPPGDILSTRPTASLRENFKNLLHDVLESQVNAIAERVCRKVTDSSNLDLTSSSTIPANHEKFEASQTSKQHSGFFATSFASTLFNSFRGAPSVPNDSISRNPQRSPSNSKRSIPLSPNGFRPQLSSNINKLAKSTSKKSFLALLNDDDDVEDAGDYNDRNKSSSSSPLQHQQQHQQRHKRSRSEATVAGVFQNRILSWRNSLCESINYNRRTSLLAAGSAAQQNLVPEVCIDFLPSSPSTVVGSNTATPIAKQQGGNRQQQMAFSEMNIMNSLVQLLARLNDSTCTQCQIEIAEFLKKHINAEEAFWLLTLEDSEELCCQVLRGAELDQWLRFDIKGDDLPDLTADREQPILVSLDGLNVQIKREIARELGNGSERNGNNTPYVIRSAMCMPLMKSEYYRHRGLLCVVNKRNSPRFTIEDSKLLHMVIKACSGTLLSKVTVEQRSRVTEALLRVAKVLFTNLEDVNELVGNILCEAKRLTNAERCSLFLVDKERGELVAKVFDGEKCSSATTQHGAAPAATESRRKLATRSSSSAADSVLENEGDDEADEEKSDEQSGGSNASQQRPRSLRTQKSRQILRTPSGGSMNPSSKSNTGEVRFAIGRGVAGHVAVTGEILNIKDAYNHPLFYSGVDQSTGFKTRSILCFPIKVDKREQQQQQSHAPVSAATSALHSAATSTASNASSSLASLSLLQQQAALLSSIGEHAVQSINSPRVARTLSSSTTDAAPEAWPSRQATTSSTNMSLLATPSAFDTDVDEKDDDDFFDGAPSSYILSPSNAAGRRRFQKPQRRVSVLNVLGGSASPCSNKMKLVTGEEINSDDVVDENFERGQRRGNAALQSAGGGVKLFSVDDMFSERNNAHEQQQQQQQQQQPHRDDTLASSGSGGMITTTTMRQCELVGVAQLCNKLNGSHFTQFDEELAKAFSMFCGISIIHVSEKDYRNLLTGAVPRPYDLDPLFDTFDYLPRNLSKDRIPEACLAVMNDLGLIERWRLKRPTLARFFCLVVRGYRDVPYHNVRHAFSVYHFAYLLSKRLRLSDYLDDLAVFAFLISAVCHDLDHRGTTNAFQVASQSVLAALYSSEGSVMERHHLAQSMCIINTEGCNIFESLSSREYGQMLDYMRDMILATDLAHHLNILPEIRQMISDGYRRDNERHRYLLTCMLMTASDLSDQSKPWQCSVEIAQLVYKEFFSQGDLEKAMGRLPCEMMDRDKAFIPHLQLQFIGEIVLPVFEQVERLFGKPKVGQLRKAAQRNIDCWQQVEERYKVRRGRNKNSNNSSAAESNDNMLTSADIFDDQELFNFETSPPAATESSDGATTSTTSNNATAERRKARRRPPSRGDNSTNNDYQLQFAAKTTTADENDNDDDAGRPRPLTPSSLARASPARSPDSKPSSQHYQSSVTLYNPAANDQQQQPPLHGSRKSNNKIVSSSVIINPVVSNKRRSSSSHTAAFFSSVEAVASRKQHEILFYTHPQGQKPTDEAEDDAEAKKSDAFALANGRKSPRAPLAEVESSSAAGEGTRGIRKVDDHALAFTSSSTSTSSSSSFAVSSNDNGKSMSPTPPSISGRTTSVLLPTGGAGGGRSVIVSPSKTAGNKAMKK